MSIPGHGSRIVAPSSTAAQTAGTHPSSSTATTGVKAAPPTMQSRAAKQNEKVFSEIAPPFDEDIRESFELYEEYMSEYLQWKILGIEPAIRIPGTDGTSNPWINKNSLHYGDDTIRIFEGLIRIRDFAAIAYLLTFPPERERFSTTHPIEDYISLDSEQIIDLANALNSSPHPLKMFFGSRYYPYFPITNLLYLLKNCPKITRLEVCISKHDEPVFRWMKGTTQITGLRLARISKYGPINPAAKQFLKMLGNMHQLEIFCFELGDYRKHHSMIRRILKKLKNANNLKQLSFNSDLFECEKILDYSIDLITNLPNLTRLSLKLEFKEFNESNRQAIENVIKVIRANKSLKYLELRVYLGFDPDDKFFDAILGNSSITHLDLGEPSKLTLNSLTTIAEVLVRHPEIVQVFSPTFERSYAYNYKHWSYRFFSDVPLDIFLNICDLLDKNRALANQALIEEYSRSFTPHHTGDGEKAPLVGPAYLDPDTAKLLTEQILYLSPDVENFKDTMNEIHLSVRAAAMQQADQEAAGIFDTSNGSVKSTKDVTVLRTTTAVFDDSIDAKAAATDPLSPPPIEGENTTLTTPQNTSTLPPADHGDAGYESDVIIDSSDDDE